MASKTNKLFKGMSTKKISNVSSMGGEVLDLPNYSGVGHNKLTKEIFDDRYRKQADTIDISDDTNLAVTDPIVLTDDTLSLNGTKQSTTFTHDAEIQVGLVADKYIKIGEVLTDSGKGLSMIRAGSIVGISINYDCTGVQKISSLSLQVMKNGSRVWNNNLATTTGTNKTFVFTQARDTNTFVAEDDLTISFAAGGIAGTIDIENIIVQLEYYYDD